MTTAVVTPYINPEYQGLYPRRTAQQVEELERQILPSRRINVPIQVDENGAILDGHHRYEIALKHDLEYRVDIVRDLGEREKHDFIFQNNSGHRPVLTSAQKREAVAASLKLDPELSDRGHAKRVGASYETVRTIRAGLMSKNDIPSTPNRRTPDGKKAPGPKPRARASRSDASVPPSPQSTPRQPRRETEHTEKPTDERPGANEYSRAIQEISWKLSHACESFTNQELVETLGAAQHLYELIRGESIIRERRK